MSEELTVEEIKRLASADDLALYAYVTEKASVVCASIVRMIVSAKTDQGGIVLVYGPQNSGKTIVACSLLDELGSNGRVVVATQPDVGRPDVPKDKLYSRTGVVRKVHSFATKHEIQTIFHRADVVIIDEIQFTPYELQSYLLKEMMAFVDRGGWVVSIGVLYTAQGGEFLLSALIKDRAVAVFEMTSTCQKCGNEGARYNQRLINGTPTNEDDPELLVPSKSVTYEPRCEQCYVKMG